MSTNSDRTMPWVIARLGSGCFGLHCASVREMVVLPPVCVVPGVPDHVRGTIHLRGRILPLVDLRRRLGMRSCSEEIDGLCDMMDQRAEDHRRWLEELDASVKERREFTLARDPHACAFGRWYDSYKTDNVLVTSFLKRFDAPHKKIHTLADQVQDLVKNGSVAEARQLLEQAQSGVLSSILRLFADLQRLLRDTHREIALVLKSSAGEYSVSVDSVESVERVSEAETDEVASEGPDGRFVTAVGKRAKGEGLVLLLAADSIL